MSDLFIDSGYPELLADIARAIYTRLTNNSRVKLEHPLAAEIALDVAEYVRKNIGGVAVYIPRGLGYELSIRDQKIYEEFTGDNYHLLARKYDMTEMRVRQIVGQIGRIEKAKRQADLFDTHQSPD